MAVTLKSLEDQTIVITGATSGIGLVTARQAARRGARLVLVARSDEDLKTLEEEIGAEGGEALTVAADVGKRDDLRRVVEMAQSRFGGFDTWVNNAGVSIWGRLDDVSDEDSRRLFETNFWGTVYGSLEALSGLRHRGGALINVGSVTSDVGFPLQGMYAASKHAVKGFTDSLRLEVEEADLPVSLTLIKPTSIDTPFPRHAKNYLPEEPKLPPPVYRPEEVAHAILFAAEHPIRDVYVGGAAKLFTTVARFAPRMMDRFMEAVMFRQQRRSDPARHRKGTLYRSRGGMQATGDHPGYVMRTSLYTRAALRPVLTGALLGLAGAAVVGALAASRSDGE